MRILIKSQSFVKLLAIASLVLAIFMLTNISTISHGSFAYGQNVNSNNNQIFYSSVSNSNDNSYSIQNEIIPAAESVYKSQTMIMPSSVGTFVWYVVNEAHENSATERHKYLSDSNPIYLPTNLVVAQGTAISFLDADAPWDSPHPHIINVVDSSGKVVYSTGRIDYTNSSTPKVLPIGKYTVMDTKYTWMKGNLTVSSSQKSTGNMIVGGFYSPTNQVANNKDNDGGVHPGSLGYYRIEFPKNGFKILTEYNFNYATCRYCPGGFWPDQKTAGHTLLVYSTSQPVSTALAKLSKMIWDNVYI